MAVDIVFLHGFLGQGSDWKDLENILRESHNVENTWAPDLFSPNSSFTINELDNWARDFSESAHLRLNSKNIKILIGYSLGGRLALEYLKNYDFFDAAIIISSQTQPLSGEEIKQRAEFDDYWAEKFLNQEWSSLIKEWNSLEIFSDSNQEFSRIESDFNREALAAAFDLWSPTLQKGTLNDLRISLSKVLFIAGEEDKKYFKQYSNLMQSNKRARVVFINGMGHRFLKNPSLQIIVQIGDFIQKLESK